MHDLSKFLLEQFQTQNGEVNNSQASDFDLSRARR